ncbi:MAG TPA: OB-fold nucleic acid binding domain-containing protein, partial [Agitococcus sp.]|nr:OB-fold nucleic acid binding domain-containing protein [Agitococcus sp.]
MSNTPEIQVSENELIAQRQQKLAELRTKGQAFPNDFRRDSYAQNLQDKFSANTKEELEAGEKQVVSVAGRIMLKRVMGKASFITVQDMTGRIQFYVAQNSIGEDTYADFKTWDIGDIVGGQGYIFKTKTGELSIHIEQVRLLT